MDAAADQRDFIRDYLGPRMEEEGVQLMGFDDQKNLLREWADTILGDPATSKYVWGDLRSLFSIATFMVGTDRAFDGTRFWSPLVCRRYVGLGGIRDGEIPQESAA